MPDFFTLDDFTVDGKTVLLRIDINSPIDPATGRLLNDARLREHLVTLRDLRRARVAVMAHQGRPGKDDFTTLEAHAQRLSQMLGRDVRYVDSLYQRPAVDAIRAMGPGDVVLLENTRFFAEEEVLANEKPEKMAKSHFVRTLAALADLFVLDAFAAAHRAQPSLVGFAEVLPAAAGRVMERELTMLGRALEGDRPRLAILGGIKVDDSVGVAKHMLEQNIVDRVLTAGGVANAFLQARGLPPGKPSVEVLRREVKDYDKVLEMAQFLAKRWGDRIRTPVDVVVNEGGARKARSVKELPAENPVVDIGLDTVVDYAGEVERARTIFLNGPAGVFEIDEFSVGTRELFTAVANSDAFTVAGGGHTVAALEQLGLASKFDHVSTGGGALLEFLAGKSLPGVEALRRSRKKFADRRER